MKRFIAFMIAAILIVSCNSFAVYAETGETHDGLKYYIYTLGTGMFNEDCRLVRTDASDCEEYVIRDVRLYAGFEFRIHATFDGVKKVKIYPSQRVNTSLMITADGLYDIYLRPNGDGGTFYDGSGWVDGCIYVDDSKAVTEHKEYLYRDKFLEFCKTSSTRMVPFSTYDELYYHKDKNGEIDWALLEARSNGLNNLVGTFKIGNRIIKEEFGYHYPFLCYMGVYDARTDCVYELLDIHTDDYEDFTRVYDEYGYGRLVGDVDGDNAITVIDSTVIQRCEVNLQAYPDEDMVTDTDTQAIVQYYSDFNYDGCRDIIDATCMQRYLADMKYPIG